MAAICIVTPARPGARNGNRHTAQRWAGFLRALGHRVAIAQSWDGQACDLLIALHARRSHASAVAWRQRHPERPLVVVLTGTDLYKDLPDSREARESLRLADRVVVLQDAALALLDAATRRKTRVVYQSAAPSVRHAPPGRGFRIAVVGHLRKEKDPFRAALALAHVGGEVDLVQVGDAIAPGFDAQARSLMRGEPRYRWLGGRSHAQTLGWIARSHLLVVSSVMEGGANVIAEAARIATPVLASRMSGNLGMLGRGYPGYFPLGDEQALARLIDRARADRRFYRRLRRATAQRRHLFTPAAEKRALRAVLAGLRHRNGRGSGAARRSAGQPR
jgi:putative glycosyltransferase (TIGR04348 family)